MEIKTIPLPHGGSTQVSIEDYEELSRFKWYKSDNGYAFRNASCGTKIYMHRQINKTPTGMMTDHINGDRLCNTRENLRTVTSLENCLNRKKNRSNMGFKGVRFSPGKGMNPSEANKWAAYIRTNRKQIHIGHFKTELDAALAYNIEAKKRFGEFAKLNEIPLDVASKEKPERFVQNKSSTFVGVCFWKAKNYWMATIAKGKKKIHRSYHKTELEAAAAYNAAALALYGASAKLNQL